MKPRGLLQRFRERRFEAARRLEIEVCSTSLGRIFVSPTFGLHDVVSFYHRGEDNNATLEKAFFGLPAYCFEWFRLGQAGITLGNDAVRVDDINFQHSSDAATGIATRAGISELEWGAVKERIYAIREAAQHGLPFSIQLLHLNAVSATLQSIAKKYDLDEINNKGQKIMNIKVDFGSGNAFHGPVAVGETIKQAYTVADAADSSQLREKLKQLMDVATRLIEVLPSDEEKKDTSEVLKKIVELANKPAVSANQIRISGAGLVEAAKTVSEMTGPISKAVAALVEQFK